MQGMARRQTEEPQYVNQAHCRPETVTKDEQPYKSGHTLDSARSMSQLSGSRMAIVARAGAGNWAL